MTPLPEDQAHDAREIARQEVANFARLLADQIASTPMRADANMNARDLWHAFNDAISRYDQGEVA